MDRPNIVQELINTIFIIGNGITTTLLLLCGGISIGMVIGTLFSILRYQKIATTLINTLISILRGTPVILQISFVYFALPGLLGIKPDIIISGIITFGLNSAAYTAEIIRAGISSIPTGQFEAAKTLHIPNYYMWKDIILPQVFRNILPGLINEVVALLKETALISTIGGIDIMRQAQMVAAEKFIYFDPLCIAGGYYYILVICIEFLGKKITTKWTIC